MKINLGKVFDTGGGGGREPIVEALSVTENGTYTPNEGVDGFNPVSVDVQPPLQTKAIEITANGQSTIVPDSEYYGLESVGLNVNVQPNLQAKSTSTTITENGTSTITLEPDSNYDGLSSASVDVNVDIPIPTFETEELVATANGTYTPSTDGYSKVRVNVSEPVSKYVVPNGMKFGYSTVFNPDDFDMSLVTDMGSMFYHCDLTSLDIGNWDVSQVTDMGNMFYYCKSLTSLDIGNWNVSKVTDMSSMFSECNILTSLDIGNWNVSNVTNMKDMFSYCHSLTSIDFSSWDMSKVTNMSYMFYRSIGLTDLNMNGAILPKINLNSWSLNYCSLTVDSLVSVLNALPQLDEGQSFTCTIGSTNLAKLTDEQKSIATNKGWSIN